MCILPAFTHAQNNDIFNGGADDGYAEKNFIQSGNPIFTGGAADGWSYALFSPSANLIFNGGTGDGWDWKSYMQPGNSIFSGGGGDGWDSSSYMQPGNQIFIGGTGDGWSSTYRPNGPLPVTILSFTAKKKTNDAALLVWSTASEINSDRFVIERSSDAVTYIKIAEVTAAGNSSSIRHYQFIDNSPMEGYNYYRLRMVDIDGKFSLTPSRVLNFNDETLQKLSCYPNPTTGKFTVEWDKKLSEHRLVINIFDSKGSVVKQYKIDQGSLNTTHCDISGLPRGTYFIHLSTTLVQSGSRLILQ